MPDAPRTFRPPGSKPRSQQKKEFDRHRGSARERGYTHAWDRASVAFLAANPLCELCKSDGLIVSSTVTDHLYRHGGNRSLFWLRVYWLALCAPCHDGPKQSIEAQGFTAVEAFAARMGRPLLSQAFPELIGAARTALPGVGGRNR